MNSNIISFLNGLLSAIILAILQHFVVSTFLYFRNKNDYSINGYWISKYNSAFDKEIAANDLVLIRVIKNKIVVKYQQYYNTIDVCNTFRGEGYIGNGRISVAYVYSDRNTYQNGVMLLTQIDLAATKKGFSGKFYELDSRIVKSNGQKIYGSELRIYGIDYVLVPIKLSIRQKIYFLLNKKVYDSHEAILNEFNRCIKNE
ncbi:hypothetical protein OXPF_13060 [Oxobacter pfennigii]|uniref:Uncharacterized protein n=1 Tax=Oxobacter pfennigii TaxID=36849 RepID=A0A0P8X322_9CLOT|nr:hypothetical protein [Oxobacter pfennigii]KPU45179.1 hypothetical protein OXPF_13060 [Oxobacter pfennigii]